MEPDTPAWNCPFDYAQALEFDPTLRHLMNQKHPTRIRLPYGEGEAWLVTRYEDVRLVTTDRRFSRHAVVGSDFPRMTAEPILQDEQINMKDPPASTRLRSLVSKGFAPRHMERMRVHTQQVVDELLDRMADHGSPADLIEYLADPLPLDTICAVLDIPQAERQGLRTRARIMIQIGADNREKAIQAKAELRSYFAKLTAQRRKDPGDDLISALATARDGDEILDDQELTVMAMLLLISGQDTTSVEIGNLAYALLTRPRELAALRANPGLLPQALDELLRFIPFRKGVGIPRIALEDVELGGVTIRAGDFVHVSYLTANRDPQAFDQPDELNLERTSPPHMTFGWGGHHCLGAPLATIELEVALGTLLARFPDLRLAKSAREVRWDTKSIWRHPLELPVGW